MWVGYQVTCPCCWSLCWVHLSSHSYGSDSVLLFLFWRLCLQNSGALSSALYLATSTLLLLHSVLETSVSCVWCSALGSLQEMGSQVSPLTSAPDLCPHLLRSYLSGNYSSTLFPFLAAQWRPCPSILSCPSSLWPLTD